MGVGLGSSAQSEAWVPVGVGAALRTAAWTCPPVGSCPDRAENTISGTPHPSVSRAVPLGSFIWVWGLSTARWELQIHGRNGGSRPGWGGHGADQPVGAACSDTTVFGVSCCKVRGSLPSGACALRARPALGVLVVCGCW